MFDNKIEFSAPEIYLESNPELPIPAKLNIPDWFKKLKHTPDKRTVKGCIPFMDSMTIGYILKLPQDYYLDHKVHNKEESILHPTLANVNSVQHQSALYQLNLDYVPKTTQHPNWQLEGNPDIKKNNAKGFHKIANPFLIKTPPGYSCLFTPPMNNSDDRFHIIPAVVDTDSFNTYINFPIVINDSKYKSFEATLKRGTPYVQILPFRRESWKMKISKLNKEQLHKDEFKYWTNFLYNYKNKIWKKKTYK